MLTPILATKLYIPPARPTAVARPRLVKRLNDGLHRKVTLIAAPAGFGKTTLISEWLAGCELPVAWLSLDEADSDPTRFLSYLVAALRTVAPQLGEGAQEMLQSPQPPPTDAILAALLNEISVLPQKIILVLDDYHVIDAKAVDEALTFLVEHLPPQMHLVIATREDPPLPLPRLRARGHLTEVRSTELRFTASEAAGFLQAMGLDLSAEDVAALETRTEGWIAGLQLAALSMQGHQDISGFVQAFAGDHRYILDYLVEEVLQRQPASLRDFLLQTAILDRLSGALCDAVTGQEQSSARLEALERGNFFVVPLDDKRHWYRYHHLFADVLHAHLLAEQRDQVPALHRRASEWYADHALPAAAIRHALAAADFERAATLIEMAVPESRRSRQEATLLGWLKALPDEVVRNRPVLSIHYAGTLLSNGQLEGVEARLRDAERWLESGAASAGQPAIVPVTVPVIVDDEAFRRLPGAIAVYRAGYALALGDVAGTVEHARRALDLVPEDDHLWHGAATALLGLAFWTSGDLEAAYRSYADGMATMRRVGHISDTIGGTLALADIRITQGRLREAMRLYEQALQLAVEHGTPALRGTADMYVGKSGIYRERNDLQAAAEQLRISQEQGDHTGFRQNPYRRRVALARLRELGGDWEGALNLLHEAERVYVSDLFPYVRPIAALRARMWLKQGKVDEALAWAREQGLTAHDDLTYLREFEHITLARILLARYRGEGDERSLLEASRLLERLLQAAQVGERGGSAIEILVLMALARQLQGDLDAALMPLQQALALAEAEGYVRVFVDEGAAMAQLLLEATRRGMMPAYTGRLLAALDVEPPRAGASPLPTLPATPRPVSQHPTSQDPTSHSLIEPLSQRELEVLRLFKSELSGPEIADELVIALSTLRTHTKGIYSKLNVNSRQAAVRRATELGLI